EPSAQEMALIGDRYHLHPLAIEDALTGAQQPKVETFGDMLFVVAKTAAVDKLESIVYGHTAMFVGPNFIVTVRLGSHRAHDALRAQLELNPERLREGADYVLHAVLDFIVDGYFPLLDRLEHSVSEMEDGAV